VSRGSRKVLTTLVLGALLLASAYAFLVLRKGFSARDEPSGIEKMIARQARHLAYLAMPRSAREMKNPLPLTPELLTEARAHFADHCALCHGNDGRGKTEIGRNLYPKSPDMTLAGTQSLSDGELFSIIKNGIRLTGMPAWGADTPQDDHASWELVHLIRHFPKMTDEEIQEMQALNPVSPGDLKEQTDEEKFLNGDAEPPATPSNKHKH
jgi:mono/diheme cytochrome c family protein